MNRQSAEMDGHKQVSIKRTNFSKSAEKSEIIEIYRLLQFINKTSQGNFDKIDKSL